MNKVILQGNVTRDPKLSYTPSGTAVANTSIATNKKYKDSNGTQVEEVEFHELVIWGASATVWGDWVKKGQQMLVVGEIKTDKWEDDNGNKRSAVKIVVREFEFCGKRGNSDSAQGSSNQSQSSTPEPAAAGIPDDDVPF